MAHICNPSVPVAWEAETGEWRVQSQPLQKRGTKQLSETLSLNTIQNRAGDVAQWSVPLSPIPGTKNKDGVWGCIT